MPERHPTLTRRGEIVRLMKKLEVFGFPRLQMFFFVMLTGAAGLLGSYLLLLAGVESMVARYPLAVGCSYLVFLVLLGLWLRTRADEYVDLPSDIPLPGGSAPGGHEPAYSGGGGQYGGGGASGNFSADDSLPAPDLPDLDIAGGDSVGDAVGGALGAADEGAIPVAIALVVAAIAAALLFACLYIVYLAPALFAELLVDAVLSASLYRRMRGLQTRHWLESAVRRTILPFVVTAVTLSVIGYVFQLHAPGARTIGEVLKHSSAPK
jgi:hypothetical protein